MTDSESNQNSSGPLYAITDPLLLPDEKLFQGVEAAIRGGVEWVQYRDKQAPGTVRQLRAVKLLKICHSLGAKLIINDDLELTEVIGADGVHLGQSDGDVRQARLRLGAKAIIGNTCHNDLRLAESAEHNGATYVAFGRFFSSRTKPGAPLAELNLLSEAKQHLEIPIVAIGGIRPEHLPQLKARGADRVAICHSLFGADDIAQQAKTFISIWSNTYV